MMSRLGLHKVYSEASRLTINECRHWSPGIFKCLYFLIVFYFHTYFLLMLVIFTGKKFTQNLWKQRPLNVSGTLMTSSFSNGDPLCIYLEAGIPCFLYLQVMGPWVALHKKVNPLSYRGLEGCQLRVRGRCAWCCWVSVLAQSEPAFHAAFPLSFWFSRSWYL